MSRSDMFRRLPPFGGDQRAVAEVVNNIMDGKTNNTGSVSFTLHATSTVIDDARINANTVILLMPKSLLAAEEIPHSFISSRTNGSATITHRNKGHAMEFDYALIG